MFKKNFNNNFILVLEVIKLSSIYTSKNNTQSCAKVYFFLIPSNFDSLFSDKLEMAQNQVSVTVPKKFVVIKY